MSQRPSIGRKCCINANFQTNSLPKSKIFNVYTRIIAKSYRIPNPHSGITWFISEPCRCSETIPWRFESLTFQHTETNTHLGAAYPGDLYSSSSLNIIFTGSMKTRRGHETS